MPSGQRRDARPRAFTAGERHAGDTLVGDDGSQIVGVGEQQRGDVTRRVTSGRGLAQHRVKLRGASRNRRRRLVQDRVAGEQVGHDDAHRLPVREVPRHDREHDAEWVMLHAPRAESIFGESLGGQRARGHVHGLLAQQHALVDFGSCGGDRLPHLARGGFGEPIARVAQHTRHFEDDRLSPIEWLLAPPSLRLVRCRDDALILRVVVGRALGEQHGAIRIDGAERHARGSVCVVTPEPYGRVTVAVNRVARASRGDGRVVGGPVARGRLRGRGVATTIPR
ncbi:MAG: hypothetical protein MUD17_09375 [Gemmatimonadaceae bacterium]|nr:hypothetical protein [Gemmatimonadaceae bacterium]